MFDVSLQTWIAALEFHTNNVKFNAIHKKLQSNLAHGMFRPLEIVCTRWSLVVVDLMVVGLLDSGRVTCQLSYWCDLCRCLSPPIATITSYCGIHRSYMKLLFRKLKRKKPGCNSVNTNHVNKYHSNQMNSDCNFNGNPLIVNETNRCRQKSRSNNHNDPTSIDLQEANKQTIKQSIFTIENVTWKIQLQFSI